jgi:rare lipoprotein A (peptidoglycan hydrolase)
MMSPTPLSKQPFSLDNLSESAKNVESSFPGLFSPEPISGANSPGVQLSGGTNPETQPTPVQTTQEPGAPAPLPGALSPDSFGPLPTDQNGKPITNDQLVQQATGFNQANDQQAQPEAPSSCTNNLCELERQLCDVTGWLCGSVTEVANRTASNCFSDPNCLITKNGTGTTYAPGTGGDSGGCSSASGINLCANRNAPIMASNLPLNTVAKVCNNDNGRCMYLWVADTGGFTNITYRGESRPRLADVLSGPASQLGITKDNVTVTPVGVYPSANAAASVTNSLNSGSFLQVAEARAQTSALSYGSGAEAAGAFPLPPENPLRAAVGSVAYDWSPVPPISSSEQAFVGVQTSPAFVDSSNNPPGSFQSTPPSSATLPSSIEIPSGGAMIGSTQEPLQAAPELPAPIEVTSHPLPPSVAPSDNPYTTSPDYSFFFNATPEFRYGLPPASLFPSPPTDQNGNILPGFVGTDFGWTYIPEGTVPAQVPGAGELPPTSPTEQVSPALGEGGAPATPPTPVVANSGTTPDVTAPTPPDTGVKPSTPAPSVTVAASEPPQPSINIPAYGAYTGPAENAPTIVEPTVAPTTVTNFVRGENGGWVVAPSGEYQATITTVPTAMVDYNLLQVGTGEGSAIPQPIVQSSSNPNQPEPITISSVINEYFPPQQPTNSTVVTPSSAIAPSVTYYEVTPSNSQIVEPALAQSTFTEYIHNANGEWVVAPSNEYQTNVVTEPATRVEYSVTSSGGEQSANPQSIVVTASYPDQSGPTVIVYPPVTPSTFIGPSVEPTFVTAYEPTPTLPSSGPENNPAGSGEVPPAALPPATLEQNFPTPRARPAFPSNPSIVDYIASLRQNPSLDARAKLAFELGLVSSRRAYKGTPEQNMALLRLCWAGKCF